MVLTLGTFFVIIILECRTDLYELKCSVQQRKTQIFRAALGHSCSGSIELSGLVDDRVKSCKCSQLIGVLKAAEIAELADNSSCIVIADTGDRFYR